MAKLEDHYVECHIRLLLDGVEYEKSLEAISEIADALEDMPWRVEAVEAFEWLLAHLGVEIIPDEK